MSLPKFNWQRKLFGLQENSQKLYAADDKYRLFASKIFPLLLSGKPQGSGLQVPGIKLIKSTNVLKLRYGKTVAGGV